MFIYKGSFSSKKRSRQWIINNMGYMGIMTSECVGDCFVLFIFISIFVCLVFNGTVVPCTSNFQYSVKTVILYNPHQINTFGVFFHWKNTEMFCKTHKFMCVKEEKKNISARSSWFPEEPTYSEIHKSEKHCVVTGIVWWFWK